MATGLWPDFKIEAKPSEVLRVLDEAGRELSHKTGGRVVLRVLNGEGNPAKYPFEFVCELWSEKLQYNYVVCYVEASVGGYPACILHGDGERSDIASEAELREALSHVFHGDKIRRVIQNLLAMNA